MLATSTHIDALDIQAANADPKARIDVLAAPDVGTLDDEGDELSTARGLALGMALGGASLSAIAALVWWIV